MKIFLVVTFVLAVMLASLGWDLGICLRRVERACLWLAHHCHRKRQEEETT